MDPISFENFLNKIRVATLEFYNSSKLSNVQIESNVWDVSTTVRNMFADPNNEKLLPGDYFDTIREHLGSAPKPTLKFVKAALIGDCQVGKTQILKWVKNPNKNTFSKKYEYTFALDFAAVPYEHKNKKLHLWELSGQHRFAEITRPYVTALDVIVFVANSEASLNNLDHWKNFVQSGGAKADVKKILVLNSFDVANATQYIEGATIIRVNAQTGDGISELVNLLLE